MTNETDNQPTALTTNTFTRAGYSFSGWTANANGTGAAYADGAIYPFTASTTLYAQWTANTSFTVIFNANGGLGPMTNETANQPRALTATTHEARRATGAHHRTSLSPPAHPHDPPTPRALRPGAGVPPGV